MSGTQPTTYQPQPQYGYGQQGYGGVGMPVSGQLVDINAFLPRAEFSGDNIPENYMDWMGGLAAGGMGVNTVGAVCNTVTSCLSIDAQKDVMNAYYGYQNKVADNALGVATMQLGLQEKALDIAKVMQEDQLEFQEKIARLESQTQVRLAKVDSDGKLERAKIFAATDAFRRNAYDYGQPFSIG